jgi:hypothetical protein
MTCVGLKVTVMSELSRILRLSGPDSWVPAHGASFGDMASKSMSGLGTHSSVSNVQAKHEMPDRGNYPHAIATATQPQEMYISYAEVSCSRFRSRLSGGGISHRCSNFDSHI